MHGVTQSFITYPSLAPWLFFLNFVTTCKNSGKAGRSRIALDRGQTPELSSNRRPAPLAFTQDQRVRELNELSRSIETTGISIREN
jgi:hypothetical protein